jgi:hypothetical protein
MEVRFPSAERVWTLVSQPIKLPAWAMLGLAIYTFLPDNISRAQWWLSVAKTTGGYVAMAADVVGSPYFGPALLVFGLLWILFVGEPTAGVQRHHWLRYVGWSVFSVCLTVVIITVNNGRTELALRTAYDQGRAGIPRGTPDETDPNRPQMPLYANSNVYSLTSDQIRILIIEIPKLKPLIRVAGFAKPPNFIQPVWNLWIQLQDVFIRSGIPPAMRDEEPRGPEEEGLMLAVKDIDQMPLAAQKIREAFEIANIRLKPIQAREEHLRQDEDFLIFIGPPPINWN